jgi:hypothetical protein
MTSRYSRSTKVDIPIQAISHNLHKAEVMSQSISSIQLTHIFIG